MNDRKIPLALEHVYRWEKEKAQDIYLTQPLGNGQVKTYTWQQAVSEARKMANYLKTLNLPAKSHIALLSKNCAQWVMADWAIWMAGHVTVPLYPTLNADTVSYILEHSEAQVLFAGKLDDWDDMKDGIPESLPCISFDLSPEEVQQKYTSWDQIVAKNEALSENTAREADEIATIVYTSGSTGNPKGVMLSFHSMAYAAQGAIASLKVTDQDRMLSYLPLAHVMERFVVEMASISVGFQLFFADKLDTFVADLNRANPTLFLAVPRIWTIFQTGVFAKMPKQKLDRLMKIPLLSGYMKKRVLKTLGLQDVRYAASGSAPLSQDTIAWYQKLGLELLEGYGMSENFGYSHMSQPGRSCLGYVGEPLPGVDCRISEQGEIQIKSPTLMMGYYKDEAKTKAEFTEDGYLKTGDRGEIDELKRLKITGRTKEIFKTSKGKYVAPAPIENKIIGHQDIEMVCVSGAEYPQPHALVVLAESSAKKTSCDDFKAELASSFQSLIKDVNSTLDPHEHIKFVTIVSDEWSIASGHLTPTMKMKRDVIESSYKPHLDDWYEARQAVVWH
ncbi:MULTISPECIES: AMP-binding protein [unclassified Oleiphilus]|jgi:long-subunit acyl-CoA synthetase (AMP-forming)|nr:MULTISPECIES: AMP-binding protein [unclassified Oleiphilus]KZY77818.1 AMP-binding acetyl-CoA synthetase [Oleiphilus sp. HI0068]KZY85033.1 AMP-binding acetyl-CoA synthetase [Oleiphilus sp. HI0072]KZY85219.1 AMP-binding acetyl-CoA synthetase [Oleiphilus sp. HI0069]KZZ47770.1 AMP-binding acetyl-CoA synthetase [Oleiphilus sp. HI0085]KZY39929.1 AMP-binding acetyl-CoA synthetase [Oleiphilus sp. HI0043]